MQTTTARNTFSVSSEGYVQGAAMDDPAKRYQLCQGIVASTETLPMWGGVALAELIPSDPTTLPMTTPWSNLGSVMKRATASTEITAFSVFNQGHHMINLPGTYSVPLVTAGMSVPY